MTLFDKSRKWRAKTASACTLIEVADPLGTLSRSVLVVDDDPMVLTLLSRLIARNQMSVQSASCGNEALRVLESGQKIDLVLTDIDMPSMTGIELRTLIVNHDEWKLIPVVLMTGGVSSGIPHGVLVLAKPFELRQIQCTIASHLGGPCPSGRLEPECTHVRNHDVLKPGHLPLFCANCCAHCPKQRYV
jgi:CheY-like chemotaxis protein